MVDGENELKSVGKYFKKSDRPKHLVNHEEFDRVSKYLLSRLTDGKKRSVLLVGGARVGKTSVILDVASKLHKKRKKVWMASPGELMAGQSYIGQIEKRIGDVVSSLKKQKVASWYVPQFHEAAYLGRYSGSNISIMDHLLPMVDKGDVQIIGETSKRSLDMVVRQFPSVLSIFEVVTMEPPVEEEMPEIVQEWFSVYDVDGKQFTGSEEVCKEAVQIAGQYFSQVSQPGSSIHFLETCVRSESFEKTDKTELEIDDLYECLSTVTGVPIELLSDTLPVTVEEIEATLEESVMGQPEAVGCLAERIALVKAGLTDPKRPWGVFLFLGSTGTGKTEICKALADYVYGSQGKLIRLDMSELQSIDDTERIIGVDHASRPSESLVAEVQQNPFSVILLDEFEKAHTRVWDYFLQVFDDGRLSDRMGRVADFRSTIIVMTSNLGASVQTRKNLGFSKIKGAAKQPDLDKTLEATFRPEFINRIDRVVRFRPLTRNTMRQILNKELGETLQRRGFAKRQWSIEWDHAAVEHLLDVGFSPTMGARPLKRAIDQEVLVPIAKTIISHQYPEGEQFLFLRLRDRKIVAEFVDPAAPALKPVIAKPTPAEKRKSLTLRSMTRRVFGTREELELLKKRLQELSEQTSDEAWGNAKEETLEIMNDADFWKSEERYEQLGWLEYVDRIEAGLKTAHSLFERLAGVSKEERGGRHLEIMGNLAQQLYLLEEALDVFRERKPMEIFLVLRINRNQRVRMELVENFYNKLERMYRQWARNRRMQLEPVTYKNSNPDEVLIAWSLSGFGVFNLMQGEPGIHMFETVEKKRTLRVKASVHVVPQPNNAHEPDAELFARLWSEEISKEMKNSAEITRRYSEKPSASVVDKPGGWRTGQLGEVLAGNFDLFRKG